MSTRELITSLIHPPTTWRVATSRLAPRDFYWFFLGLVAMTGLMAFATGIFIRVPGISVLCMAFILYYGAKTTLTLLMTFVNDVRG